MNSMAIFQNYITPNRRKLKSISYTISIMIFVFVFYCIQLFTRMSREPGMYYNIQYK